MTKRTKAGQFAKGSSGNPKGKPEGSRNKVTIAAENVLEEEAEKLSRKAVELAMKGDGTALRLCIERILPVKKERKVKFDLGEVNGVADHPAAQGRIAKAVSNAELAPSEGLALTSMLDAQRRSLETAELAERLARIEESLSNGAR